MHYELIRMAIESKKYQNVDIGLILTVEREICFVGITLRTKMHAKGMLTRNFLWLVSKIVRGSIDQEGHLKFKWQKTRRTSSNLTLSPVPVPVPVLDCRCPYGRYGPLSRDGSYCL